MTSPWEVVSYIGAFCVAVLIIVMTFTVVRSLLTNPKRRTKAGTIRIQ